MLKKKMKQLTNRVSRNCVMADVSLNLENGRPKRGMSDFLHDYLEAERIGQSNDMSCATEFPTCPVSLYNIFRSYSTPEDKPDGSASDADHSSQPPDQYDYYDAEAKDTYGPPLASDRLHSPKEPHDNNIDSTK